MSLGYPGAFVTANVNTLIDELHGCHTVSSQQAISDGRNEPPGIKNGCTQTIASDRWNPRTMLASRTMVTYGRLFLCESWHGRHGQSRLLDRLGHVASEIMSGSHVASHNVGSTGKLFSRARSRAPSSLIFLMPMARTTVREHFVVRRVQRGKQGCGSMTSIIVGHAVSGATKITVRRQLRNISVFSERSRRTCPRTWRCTSSWTTTPRTNTFESGTGSQHGHDSMCTSRRPIPLGSIRWRSGSIASHNKPFAAGPFVA
jgi:hypothetical protein